MSRKSRRNRRHRLNRKSPETGVQSLEDKALLSGVNPTFADPGATPAERAARANLERNVQRPNPGPAFQQLDANSDGQLVPGHLDAAAYVRPRRAGCPGPVGKPH